MTKDISFDFSKVVPEEAVVNLYREAGWWGSTDPEFAAIPKMIAGSFAFLVARHPVDGIIGMGRVISDGISDAYIQDVVVCRAWRGRGVGGAIVKQLGQYCVEKKLLWIGLVAEPGTTPFYQRLGFAALEGFTPMVLSQKEIESK